MKKRKRKKRKRKGRKEEKKEKKDEGKKDDKKEEEKKEVFAMLEVGKTLDVVISREGGPVKPKKLVILTTPHNGIDAQKVYADKDKVNPITQVDPLVAET
uniref:tRNA-binding domain-containing protein n=1 Tax=Haemonchus contortus TaxID=6289 RepID=A0A7I5ED35_HAECO